MFKKKQKKKKYVGFVVPHLRPYPIAMASTRIRVHDVIRFFAKDAKIKASFFIPYFQYDIVVFQKIFHNNAYKRALSLKKCGVKIVLDINVNYYDSESFLIHKKQREDIIRFSDICDGIISSSEYIASAARSLYKHKKIVVIEESIHNKYFKQKKIFSNGNIPTTFIWSGYHAKAKDLYLVAAILKEMFSRHHFKIIIISDKNPEIDMGSIPVFFIQYKESNIVKQLLQGDIFIAPRNMGETYNLGHTFTKVGVAMALGLPVCASPVPSYIGSPALINNSDEDWRRCFEELLTGKCDIADLSQKGILYCQNRLGSKNIKKLYDDFFLSILS